MRLNVLSRRFYNVLRLISVLLLYYRKWQPLGKYVGKNIKRMMAFNRKFCNSYTNFLVLLNATIIIWPIDINHLTILSRSDIERGSNYILFQFRPLTNDKNRLLDRCLHVNIYFRSLSNRGATESICIVYITWVHEISYKKINVYKYVYKYRRRMYPNKSEVSTNEERSILKEHKFGAFLVSYIIRSYWYLQITDFVENFIDI